MKQKEFLLKIEWCVVQECFSFFISLKYVMVIINSLGLYYFPVVYIRCKSVKCCTVIYGNKVYSYQKNLAFKLNRTLKLNLEHVLN